MRVAFNISCLYHPDGRPVKRTGVQHYTDSLLAALCRVTKDQSHESEVYAFAPLGSLDTLSAAHKETDWAWWAECGRETSSFLDTAGDFGPVTQTHGLLGRVRRSIGLRRGLRGARYAANQYDLMQVCAPSYLPLERYASRHNVATIHDMSVRTDAWAHEPENVAAWEQLNRWAVERCDRVLTVSEAAKAEIIAHLGIPAERVAVAYPAPRAGTHTIPPGLARDECVRQVLKGEGKEPFLLYAGALEPRKNVEGLVKAFAYLTREAPQVMSGVRLVLAGGAWKGHDDYVRRVCEEEGVSPLVIMTGYVDNETMNALMSACTAFAYVSLLEGFGMPPLEAMACGAPVIVSNTSSLPEVVGEAGIKVSPGSQEEIAQALHLLLTDAEENSRRRALSRARAAHFTWDKTALRVLQVYKEALAG